VVDAAASLPLLVAGASAEPAVSDCLAAGFGVLAEDVEPEARESVL
jgi:hypothetical protein